MSRPATHKAISQSGLSYRDLARASGLSLWEVWPDFGGRLSAENAGKLTRVLGEAVGLSASERKAVFLELVNLPGQSRLYSRVSSEHPLAGLWEQAASEHPDFDERPELGDSASFFPAPDVAPQPPEKDSEKNSPEGD